ncbi:MAG: DUF502 domain-containing protein [Epulopiscium sp.]|nr:DUF502 domain-containing protein [Candidatus Epulonipiscium sp.]
MKKRVFFRVPWEGIRQSFGALRYVFITGLITILPLAFTVYALQFLFSFIDRWPRELVSNVLLFLFNFFGLTISKEQINVPGMGLFISLLIICTVGYVSSKVLGRKLWKKIEDIILKIPIMGNIYTAFAKIFDTLFQHNQKAFREVALIPYPYKGCYTLGFITGDGLKEINDHIGEKMVSVFIPTTPNPTSGFMLLIKEKDVTVLKMPVEVAMKLIVSGGILKPENYTKDEGES